MFELGVKSTDTTAAAAFHFCSAEHKAARAAAEAQQEANKTDAAAAEGGGVAAASSVPKVPVPAFPVKSVLSMTRAEARALGVPWMRMAQVSVMRCFHMFRH